MAILYLLVWVIGVFGRSPFTTNSMNPLPQSQQQLATEASPLDALMAKPVSPPTPQSVKDSEALAALTIEVKALRKEVTRLTPFEAAYSRLIAQKEKLEMTIQAAYEESLQSSEVPTYRQRPRVVSACAVCGSARCAYPRRVMIPEDQYNPSRESRNNNPWMTI